MTAIRRLLIVMLVLLAVSTVAAALLPPQDRLGRTGGTQTQPTDTGEARADRRLPDGRALSVRIEIGGPRVKVVPLRVGDQLSLQVLSGRDDVVEIPAFGLVKAVGPDAPALFELLAERPGGYGVRLLERRRVVARLEVSSPDPRKDERTPQQKKEGKEAKGRAPQEAKGN